MDKMYETIKIAAMICVVIFFYYCFGLIDFYSPYYEAADPSDPSAVTIHGRTASLLSGYNNLRSAFSNDFSSPSGCMVSFAALTDLTYAGYMPDFGTHYAYSEYKLDAYGEYSGICSAYNGITASSTKEELEAAFGENCIKTDDYYAEIFINGKEFDYGKKQDYPADFYGYYFYFGDWFDYIAAKYPDTETVTVLICGYGDDTPNDITFYIYDKNEK
ncbi:MAG: hypothetical protein NC395_04170 [Prevotella sp.]|nr:hypothetical protein [Prevotella sp.]